MVFDMENILVKELKRKFDQAIPRKFDSIYINKRPFQSPKLKKQWYEIYGRPLNVSPSLIPPLQPEIDMILFKGDTMISVEIKYFRRKGRGLDHPFYEGIEQALALSRWGFDNVALWQLFEETITKEELFFYGGWTWNFLHAEPMFLGLKLPIEFTMMRVKKRDREFDLIPINVLGPVLVEILPPYDPKFEIRAPHPNPLLVSPEVKRLRKILIEWLKTQKP